MKSERWSQPAPGLVDSDGDLLRPWDNVPLARGAHGACLVEDFARPDDDGGSSVGGLSAGGASAGGASKGAVADPRGPAPLRRRLVIFGGYGEAGGAVTFGRLDFNDLFALDLDTWEWEEIEAVGSALPDPRSACQLAYVPGVVPPNEPATSPRLYLTGGWNAMGQFSDVWVLDLETCVWTLVESATGDKWGLDRWEHSMHAVCCVPHWKIFNFGGKTGDIS